jgi:hypothetical protein
MNENILICIASCDNFKNLKLTVETAYKNSKYPNKIHFSIFWHPWIKEDFAIKNIENLNIIIADYDANLPLGISRNIAMSLPNNKCEYYLQVDSHMIFCKNWDEKLINSYKKIENKENNSKIIISSYVPAWYEENNKIYSCSTNEEIDPFNFNSKNAQSAPLQLIKNNEINYNKIIPLIDGNSNNLNWNNMDYVEHFLISGHFMFSKFNFVTEIIPDPLYSFYEEQIVWPLRFSTREYKIFCIKENIVWHKDQKKSKDLTWRNNNYLNIKKQNLFEIFKQHNNKRIKNILLGNYFGYWGAPSFKKLKEYEEKCNFNFKNFYKN